MFSLRNMVRSYDLCQAAVSALQALSVINGDYIIYRDYINISIAVGTSKVCIFFYLVLKVVHQKCSDNILLLRTYWFMYNFYI